MKTERVADGIYKKTTDAGSVSYFCRFKANGKTVVRGLGSAKEVSLREARLRYAQIVTEYKEEPTKKTMGSILDEAIESIIETSQWKHPKSIEQFNRVLRVRFAPLHDIPVNDISRDDILSVLKPIWTTIPVSASFSRWAIKKFLSWCIAKGYRETPNAAAWTDNMEFFLPSKRKVHREKHMTAATVEQAREVVAKCMAEPDGTNLCILLCIATASRTIEVLGFKHKDVKDGTWYVPPELRKDGLNFPHRVPLNRLAKWAVERMKTTPMVSPLGYRIKSMTMLHRLKKMGFDITNHGFRSTFRDWCAVNGVPDAVAEKSLMHRWGNAVTEAYLREDLLAERRKVMDLWAKVLL